MKKILCVILVYLLTGCSLSSASIGISKNINIIIVEHNLGQHEVVIFKDHFLSKLDDFSYQGELIFKKEIFTEKYTTKILIKNSKKKTLGYIQTAIDTEDAMDKKRLNLTFYQMAQNIVDEIMKYKKRPSKKKINKSGPKEIEEIGGIGQGYTLPSL